MKINRTDSMSRRRNKSLVAFLLITACVMAFANAQEANNSKPAKPRRLEAEMDMCSARAHKIASNVAL